MHIASMGPPPVLVLCAETVHQLSFRLIAGNMQESNFPVTVKANREGGRKQACTGCDYICAGRCG